MAGLKLCPSDTRQLSSGLGGSRVYVEDGLKTGGGGWVKEGRRGSGCGTGALPLVRRADFS
eukprot:3485968-Rhodomonas_salina.1